MSSQNLSSTFSLFLCLKNLKATVMTKSQQSKPGRPALTALLSCTATSFGHAADLILFVPTVFSGLTCEKSFGTQSSHLTDHALSLPFFLTNHHKVRLYIQSLTKKTLAKPITFPPVFPPNHWNEYCSLSSHNNSKLLCPYFCVQHL